MTSADVHHLDRLCRCGHYDFDHVSRYYETGNRGPVCRRNACPCSHFTVNTEMPGTEACVQTRCELCQEPVHLVNGTLVHDFSGSDKCTYKSHL